MISRKLNKHPRSDCRVLVSERGSIWFYHGCKFLAAINPEGWMCVDINGQLEEKYIKWFCEEQGIDWVEVIDMSKDNAILAYNIYTGGYFYASDF